MDTAMNRRNGAMRRRDGWWLQCLAAASIALPAVAVRGQVTTRDSSRVYRIQMRTGDAEYERTIRRTRQQLEERLDSLQHEFEGLGLDAPDRVALSRQLRTLISSLDDMRQLEQEISARVSESTARSLQRAQIRAGALANTQAFAGRLRTSMSSLQPGWIGITAEAPHTRIIVRNDSAYVRYLGYPEVVSVEPDSPAERVGISRGDQLIAYDGADLRDREINLTKVLQPARRLRVTIRRDGEERDFPVIVGKPPLQVLERRKLSVPSAALDGSPETVVILPPSTPSTPRVRVGGGMVFFNRLDPESAPLAGAQLVWIHGDAWENIFDVASGVLVTDVFSDPARASGLKVGDVVLRADGQDLTSVAQLRRVVDTHRSDRTVELQIVRQKRARTVTLRW
jgi:S1-C subfamily serine protease